jgi:hypothetical protein
MGGIEKINVQNICQIGDGHWSLGRFLQKTALKYMSKQRERQNFRKHIYKIIKKTNFLVNSTQFYTILHLLQNVYLSL